ncbi:ATP-dependent DNA helicase RecG [Patescibacteria group bacterium]
MKPLTLSMPVSDLYMVGQTYANRLKKLDIETVEDLLNHYPFRYDDYSLISNISQVRLNEIITIKGKVSSFKNVYTKRGKKIQEAVISDSSGEIDVIWFNQPFLANILKRGVNISLAGKVGFFSFKKALIAPEYEILRDKKSIHTGRLVPVYPETYGVSSKWLRSRIAPLLEKFEAKIPDYLPINIKKENNLINLSLAIKQIHFPEDRKEYMEAKKRLSFDELFIIQLAAQMRKKAWQKTKLSHILKIKSANTDEFIKTLPFKLTKAQDRSIAEILNDMNKSIPMNRLLQGDVGSGKTVVAAMGVFAAFKNKLQSAIMVPTEILAKQHFLTFKQLFKPFGMNIMLVTSSSKAKKSKKMENKKIDLYIGTHALLYRKLNLKKLAYVVIDEQHRFGVEQRAVLINKGATPHTLTMTATPIPRTIALTIFSDLDLSLLDEMPIGRIPVKTWVVPTQKRADAYTWIKDQVAKSNGQAFIICPLIEESEKETMTDIKAAKAEFDQLKNKIFPTLKLGLLHGRMKTKEKDKVIDKFKDKKIDILVSTPVVEVGIDIPNATIMLIEAAERFGLAQLHQLRGRVGRSDKQSYCFLFTSQKDKENISRLKAMQAFHSGHKLAEVDFKIRGPGELYGTKQHGLDKLKIASFTNAKLVSQTRKEAMQISQKISQFPLLKSRLENYTMKLIEPN